MRARQGSVVAALGVASLLGPVAASGALAEDGASTVHAASRGPAEVCLPAAIPFDAEAIHLTGRWSADDGTMVYVRQVGDRVWLSAMSDYEQVRDEIGREVSSVGYGTLTGTTLLLEVAEVPRGNVYNAGTISGTVGADPDGNLQAQTVAPDGSTTVYKPCQPGAIEATEFARPFRYVVPFGLASWNDPATSDLQVMFTPDFPESGISFWFVGPHWEASCSAPGLVVPTDRGAASLEAYLRAVPELAVSHASAATVAGHAATVVDVTTSTDPSGCDGDGYVRMFSVAGSESGLSPGRAARLFLLDVGGGTFVIELWGADPDAWWPVAQGVVDSVSFDSVAAPGETTEPAS
jgi:hypothetical protein